MSKARAERRGTKKLVQSFCGPERIPDGPTGRGDYWQNPHLNARMFQVFRNEIMTLALNRFRWEGLPDTVDSEFLEWCLLMNGEASIAFPRSYPGMFLATRLAANAPLNIYRRPTKWQAVTDLGGHFECTPFNGAVVYDSQTRFPLMMTIEAYAQELADVYITKRVNRYHQRIPLVLRGPQDKELDIINIAKQVGGGEPMVIGVDSIADIEVEAITQKPAPFLGAELTDAERAIWARVFDALGIPNVIFKHERQITSEVEAQNEQTSIIRLGALRERRKAADELNRRFYEPNEIFPKLLERPISVVKAEDYESNVWNQLHMLGNLEAMEDSEEV